MFEVLHVKKLTNYFSSVIELLTFVF